MSDDSNTSQAPEFVPVPNAQPDALPDALPETRPVAVDPEPPASTRKKRTQKTVQTVDPVTANVTTTDVLGEVILDALPASATLAAPYAFYDDAGTMHSWAAGQMLVDADEIAMLLDRGALFTPE